MTLDKHLGVGRTITLGTHRFGAEEIKAFARKFDPQPFHMDEKSAEKSVFGRLCASGWHTASTWMRYNVLARDNAGEHAADGSHPEPEFGPSPGFRNLKWLKPVYAGETITFKRTVLGHRPLASRPGWRLMTVRAEAFDSTGDKVIEFESAVLVKAE
ncbi:MaoC family dehydratase [Mesorhizobium koreense]|jgi:acyl dehydratase|uniref:MaoC family dehydratase n=1 Tax=Mesorhizobium koreense TaxID=3074855 RepID=UPI00287B8848|nr:MaoC family dehydratase [Mesorhizobium sp. WR6]